MVASGLSTTGPAKGNNQPMRRHEGVTLVVSGLVLTAAAGFWATTGDATGHIPRHLAVYGLAFAAYLAALMVAPKLSPRGVVLALALAGLWRLALVATPPLLSDDVFRYVWEGRIQHQGGNPYTWDDRPDAPRWTALRDSIWQEMNHKGYTAFYPPAWQLVVRAITAVSESVAGMKLFLIACEMATALVLLRILDRRGLPRGRVLVLAWSPLALVETAGSGHNDAFGMLLLVVALLALETGQTLSSAASIAVGFATKILPGFIGLAWGRRYRPRDVAVAAAVVVAVTLPYISAGRGIVDSLQKYAAYWRFNESAFALVALVIPDQTKATSVCSVLLAALALWLGWRRVEPVAAGLVVVGVGLLLAANILPWYVLWLLPFLVLRDCPPALLYTGTVSLAYLVYPIWQSGERWHVGWDIRALEYGPCAIVAAISAWRRWASS
jgi:alpha-1,6-mannosyltransferase